MMGKLLRVLALLYVAGMIFFGWGWLSARLEIFPYRHIEPYFSEVRAFFTESHKGSIGEMVTLDHQESESAFPYAGFHNRDPDFRDDGYLLISR